MKDTGKEKPLYTLCGAVVHGNHLGRKLGFPTANLPLCDCDSASSAGVNPPPGVYASVVSLPDGRSFKAVTNVGVHPTVGSEKNIQAESYIIDYNGDLYGQDISVQLYKFLRGEEKFASVEQLMDAVFLNIAQTKEYFNAK